MGGAGAAADGGCWALLLTGSLKPAADPLQLWVTALLLLDRTPESQGKGQRARRSHLPHLQAEAPGKPVQAPGLRASGCLYVLYTWPLAPTAAFFDSGDLN